MGEMNNNASKAIRELEELYLGVPDESVNLTFEDLAEVKQQFGVSVGADTSLEKKFSGPLDPSSKSSKRSEGSSTLNKLPSLDFNRGLEASRNNLSHHNHVVVDDCVHRHLHYASSQGHHHANTPKDVSGLDDISYMSGISMASFMMSKLHERGGRRQRRPGIPHSNICTVCSTYIYLFRHRCLVCGRVYCKQCVNLGMGEMTEGRKCIECLGKRFSQRYIARAGQVGCFMRYPSTVKQQELMWAERGPRRSGENKYGRNSVVSKSRSQMTSPRTPSRAHAATSGPPSFVTNSSYSPYSSKFSLPL